MHALRLSSSLLQVLGSAQLVVRLVTAVVLVACEREFAGGRALGVRLQAGEVASEALGAAR